MRRANLVTQAVRYALVIGSTASVVYMAGASAQSSAGDQSPAQLGKVEVTGTRIKRTDIEQSQPVTRLSRSQIQASGLTSIGDLLQRLTSAGAALNTQFDQTGGTTFTGGGETNIDLRYLGAKRVLVLVNGHRWVTSIKGTVDLNTIPVAIVDHIELLQDGASSIYGSDAISGVVNIITIKNFDGQRASAYYGGYKEPGEPFDGQTQHYDFTIGRGNDDSNILWDVSYRKQKPIYAGNRDISREPVFGTGSTRGSSATPQGRFAFIPPGGPLTTNGNCPVNSQGQASCDLTLRDGATGTSANDFRPFNPTDRFNFQSYTYDLAPEERISTFVQGHTKLTDYINFSADITYSHRRSGQRAAPTPLFFASTSLNVTVPKEQPFNPFGFDLTTEGDAPNLQLIGRRFLENGARRFSESEDTLHFSGGFDGNFALFNRNWSWNVDAVLTRDEEKDTNRGRFDVSRLQSALGDPNVCAATRGCVPLNLFGGQGPDGTGSITRSQLDYIGYVEQDEFDTHQRIYEANLSSSDIFDLPGGPLGLALGYQYREQYGGFQPDALATQGNDSFNPGIPVPQTTGSTRVDSEYLELDVPVLADLPGAQLLDIDAAVRHSAYSSFGGTTNSRVGIKYQPIHDMLLRASWSQGFRAPNINELFAGQTNQSTAVVDPCSNYTQTGVAPAVQQRCAAAGVPPGYVQPNPQINVLEGGNGNLDAESSISKTVGFVYSPGWLEGFNINADYYRIDLENTIQPTGAQNIANGCYLAGDAAQCALISRSLFGGISTLNDSQTNIGGTFTDGVDAEARYKFPSTPFGDFTIDASGTYTRTFQQFFPTATGGRTTTDLVGIERGGSVFPYGIPRYKARADLSWDYSNWSADLIARYVDDLTESCSDSQDGSPTSLTNLGLCSDPNASDNTKSKNHIGAITYFDIQGTYHWSLLNSSITLGIRNVFDRSPPSSTQAGTYDPTLYEVPGRFPYVRVSTTF